MPARHCEKNSGLRAVLLENVMWEAIAYTEHTKGKTVDAINDA
jgi:hypothetical protein